MNLYSDSEILETSLRNICGKDDEERKKAVADIKGHVETAARELSLERFANFENELYQTIFSYVYAETLCQKRGGILAIRELIDCTSAAAEGKVIKFANTLATALKTNADFDLLEMIAEALGYMARHSPVSHVDYVESELNRALEWLRSTQPHRLFAACVILQQLADNAPTIFFVRTKEFFDLIWVPLWDAREVIRVSASKALSACLAVLSQRTYHLQWYCNIYSMIHEGFNRGTAESVHGSVLVAREMLTHTGSFMLPRFKELCSAIIGLKEHKSLVVRAAIASLLPELASFCPDVFARTHLNESIELLVKCATDLRPQALLSTGKLCRAIGSHLVERVDDVSIIVQEALFNKNRKVRMEVAPEALQCVADMVLGLGEPFHEKVVALLEPMMQGGLTEELIKTLTVIATHMPYQRPVIQQRLLEEATRVLGGTAKPRVPEPDYLYSWARKGVRCRRKPFAASSPGQAPTVPGNRRSESLDNAAIAASIGMQQSAMTTTGSVLQNVPSAIGLNVGIIAPIALRRNMYSGGSGIVSPRLPYGGPSPAPNAGMPDPNSPMESPLVVLRNTALSLIGLGRPSPSLLQPTSSNNLSTNYYGTPSISTSTAYIEQMVRTQPEKVLLSLRTLGSLAPPASTLLLLVQQSVLPYTLAEDPAIRKEAAITCTQMLSTSAKPFKTRGPTAQATEEIITRLLELVVTDPVHSVRLAVLNSLNADFDIFLRRAHHIETLLFLLSDENFEIRMSALSILGRLAVANAAAVLPPLRQLILRILSEIKDSADHRLKEDAALLLCTFLRSKSLQPVMKPFVGTIVRTLPLGSDVRLTTASLEALGELCSVVGDGMLPYSDQLTPMIIANMYDSVSRKKQEMAVKTLGRLVSATGQVVRPYMQYPELLPRALDLLFKNAANTPWSLRMEVLRTVGLMGALEPHKYTLIVAHLQFHEKMRAEKRSASGSEGELGTDSFKGDALLENLVTGGGGIVSEYRPHSGAAHTHIRDLESAATAAAAAGQQIALSSGATVQADGQKANLQRDMLIHTDIPLDDDSNDAPAHLFMYEQSAMRSLSEPIIREEPRRTPNSEDYYPRVAITALMKILRDPSLSVHHSSVTQAIMLIFKSLGIRCVPFLDQIVPYLLQIARKCGPGLRESLLQQLALLTSIVHHHISPYLPTLFEIIHDYWSVHLENILVLVEELATTATDSFNQYLPVVLPLLLSSLTVPKGISTANLKSGSPINGVQSLLKPLEQTLYCYDTLRGVLRPYIHLIVPALCKLIVGLQEVGKVTVPWQAKSVRTLRRICTSNRGAVVEQSINMISRIIHCLTRTITLAHEEGTGVNEPIYQECLLTICALGSQMGPKFLTFDGLIRKSTKGKGFDELFKPYCTLSDKLRSGSIPEFRYTDTELGSSQEVETARTVSETDLVGIATGPSQWYLPRPDSTALSVGGAFLSHVSPNHYAHGAAGVIAAAPGAALAPYVPNVQASTTNLHLLQQQQQQLGLAAPMQYPPKALAINQQQLARSWDVSQRSTAADWTEWLRRLKVDMLKESPSPALRSCAALAQAYHPLARDLFHAAFVSCWQEISEQYQESLVRALQTAFRSNTIPAEILQDLLNLAEFMERDVEALPISLSILAEHAQKGHAYAKALHYRELEFHSSPASCFESLININKKLDQYDAAIGVLKVVDKMQKKHPELKDKYTVREAWLAKLGHWNEALRMYDERLAKNPKDGVAIAGKLKCLDALGRWEEAIHLCTESMEFLKSDGGTSGSSGALVHSKAAVIGARAAWSLNGWDLMETFVSQLPSDNIDASFMRAVLAVHNEKYKEAESLIEQTRKHLDGSIRALLAESYGRAYVPLIMVQQCSELEEITEYKALLKEANLSITTTGATPAASLPPSASVASFLHCHTEESFRSPGGGNSSSDAQRSLTSFSRDASVANLSNLTGTTARGNRGTIGRLTSSIPRSPRAAKVMFSSQEPFSLGSPQGVPPSSLMGAGNGSAFSPMGSSSRAASHGGSIDEVDTQQQALRAEAIRRKNLLAEKWRRRLKGCVSSGRAAIPFWKYLLNGRRLVLSEREDLDTWLEFASLCRNGGNTALAERVLKMSQRLASTSAAMSMSARGNSTPATRGRAPSHLQMDDGTLLMERKIKFALLKQQWVVSDRQAALSGLEALIKSYGTVWGASVSSSTSSGAQADAAVYLECLLKLGEWKIAMIEPGVPVDVNTRNQVLSLYDKATLVDPQSYRAWHQWGLSSYRAVEEIRGAATRAHAPHGHSPATIGGLSSIRNRSGSIATVASAGAGPDSICFHAANAVKGLMRAMSVGTRMHSSSVAQDMLCILSVWFKYCKLPEVATQLETGLSMVHLDNWLGVLPQLIARIDHPEPNARRLLHNLLSRLGMRHAQALVYPLSVALKSPKGNRKEAAESLMASLRQHSAKLIDQALLVSQELVRVAILWQEVWHESLEEASRQYFGDGNVQAMLETLIPLHTTLEGGPNTLREASFCQAYGHDLNEAFRCIKDYKKVMTDNNQIIPQTGAAPSGRRSKNSSNTKLSLEETLLHQAWDLYYAVFKRINAQLPQVTMLELQYCSPALLNARDLDLAVPGTYTSSGYAVRIRNFGPNVAIIRSKQRPRRIRIYGDDGKEFVFLLKGHEDLRQDERAIQLFGLVNALLRNNRPGSEGHDLSIQRYAVIPLSPTAGLISWVPNSDTLHDLIRDYRESRKIMLNVEHKLMQQVAPNQTYDSLPTIHKLEVFEYALANTTGEDLAKILWLKSETSEVWLQRRANYTRSLAVMSMVGYVLGLGDRHPSNLMLDRKTGKVLHIDFGDCFEVAMQREKFPEKVPFRLTRMLVNAMEVSGIEGSYRLTCEKVMGVLRENYDSLVATLEAFVHDPLISWRLLHSDKKKNKKGPDAKPAGEAAAGGKVTDPKTQPGLDASTVAAPGTTEGKEQQQQPPVVEADSTTPQAVKNAAPALSTPAPLVAPTGDNIDSSRDIVSAGASRALRSISEGSESSSIAASLPPQNLADTFAKSQAAAEAASAATTAASDAPSSSSAVKDSSVAFVATETPSGSREQGTETGADSFDQKTASASLSNAVIFSAQHPDSDKVSDQINPIYEVASASASAGDVVDGPSHTTPTKERGRSGSGEADSPRLLQAETSPTQSASTVTALQLPSRSWRNPYKSSPRNLRTAPMEPLIETAMERMDSQGQLHYEEDEESDRVPAGPTKASAAPTGARSPVSPTSPSPPSSGPDVSRQTSLRSLGSHVPSSDSLADDVFDRGGDVDAGIDRGGIRMLPSHLSANTLGLTGDEKPSDEELKPFESADRQSVECDVPTVQAKHKSPLKLQTLSCSVSNLDSELDKMVKTSEDVASAAMSRANETTTQDSKVTDAPATQPEARYNKRSNTVEISEACEGLQPSTSRVGDTNAPRRAAGDLEKATVERAKQTAESGVKTTGASAAAGGGGGATAAHQGSFRPGSHAGFSLNNMQGSFKQIQHQMHLQRLQQQRIQQMLPSQPSQHAAASLRGGASTLVAAAAMAGGANAVEAGASFRPNLHLEMSSLANSASLHSPHRTSYSIMNRSVRALSIAQEMADADTIARGRATEEEAAEDIDLQQEVLTDKAVTVIRRVMDKLTGLDFYDPASLAPPKALDVQEQVDRLIIQATSNENLCSSFLGWCPFW